MNYDTAYALQKEMRDSAEYKALKTAQAAVEGDDTAKKLVKDFMTLQMQAEYARMAQAPEAEESMKKLQDLTYMVNANTAARDFLQAYTTWVKASEDIYRIISEPITEGMSILEK